MDYRLALFLPMFYKHAWTAYNARRGRYPGGLYAKGIALYEAAFYLWALTLSTPLAPLVWTMVLIHLAGVPLYFTGALSRYAAYGRAYSLFEAAELAVLAALAAFLV
ncbi:hypothetical protein [Pyrobaculum calidifontis]|uniref:Uncharacterized protein n=1 Tax=Pyrobaculum calidifontis (strain DSM 21063 / JCM 11548 / VA1) TaxID=410359 RepID=A3MXG5_PYRCJ|nr:hypothetical protein [Pyrobaculum calidifontis]ABO09332.1 conserved hypothetical protein [Pyrobaculum calidifontis JCM 11548]